MVLYNQRLGNNLKIRTKQILRKEEFIMKYDLIVIKGNWTERVDTVLQHEGIDKELIIAIQITWDIEKKETKFSIYSRG